MKSILLTIFFSVVALSATSQVFEVDTIFWSGPTENRVTIAILGDGYTASEQDDFIDDATLISNYLFTTTPYLQYQNYYNVLAIKVISNESGVSHAGNSSDNACGSQPIADVDNFFGSSFDCGNGAYHRLLCATRDYLIPGVMADNCPDYDQVLVLGNTEYYGGAGGQNAVTSMHPSANEIAIHEIGHSFAELADEYWAGSQYTTNSRPNMTSNSDISTVKWSEWVGENSVGLYPYSGDPDWFKPVDGQCKMEYLGINYPFCPVCREAHILVVEDLIVPYDSYSPAESTVSTAANAFFEIDAVQPDPNTLRIQWTLNGAVIKTGLEDSLTLLFAQIPDGINILQATLLDTSGFIRNENHVAAHSYSITWSVNKTSLGISSNAPKTDDLAYKLYPNPLTSQSVLQYELSNPGNVRISITDLNGSQTKEILNEIQKSGIQSVPINNQELKLSNGTYIISLEKDGSVLLRERLVISE